MSPQKVSVDKIRAASAKAAAAAEEPDSPTTSEASVEEDLEADKKRAQLRDQKQLTELRQIFAERAYWYLCIYSAFSAVFLLLSGFSVLSFKLPDITLTTIVGSTAVSAIGLVALVIRGLFPPSNSGNKKK